MATSNLSKGLNDSRLLTKMLHKKFANLNSLMQRCWYCSGTPVIASTDYLSYPAAIGDLAYDYTNNDVYIVTVAPAAATSATFVKIID